MTSPAPTIPARPQSLDDLPPFTFEGCVKRVEFFDTTGRVGNPVPTVSVMAGSILLDGEPALAHWPDLPDTSPSPFIAATDFAVSAGRTHETLLTLEVIPAFLRVFLAPPSVDDTGRTRRLARVLIGQFEFCLPDDDEQIARLVAAAEPFEAAWRDPVNVMPSAAAWEPVTIEVQVGEVSFSFKPEPSQ